MVPKANAPRVPVTQPYPTQLYPTLPNPTLPGTQPNAGIFGADEGVNASADRHVVAGHAVYSAYFGKPGMVRYYY